MPALNREARAEEISALKRWIAEQHAEYENEAFPEEVRGDWEANNSRLDTLLAEQAEIDARDARLRRLRDSEDHQERGDAYLPPTGRQPSGSSMQVISRMAEADVHDMRTLRTNPFSNPDLARTELRDRALRAVELAHFPDYMDRDGSRRSVPDPRGHVERLLRRHDETWQGEILARRILTTGAPAYRRGFAKTMTSMLRGTVQVFLSPEEQQAMESVRAMAALTGSAGGFAVPYTLDPTIIPTSNLSVNPYRAACRVEQITVNEWRGVTSAGVTAAYAGESSPASDNSPTLAQPAAIVQRAECFVPVSIELTQDWGAIQTELANLIQDAKDDLEAVQFSTGTGTAPAPQGIITGSTNTLTAGGVASFAVADLYTTEQTLPPRFRPRAQWIANRAIYNKVRQFDTAGGAALWMPLPAPLQEGLSNNVPRGGNIGRALMEYPANECSGLAAVLTTGSKILVMGDLRYYIIVDRIGMDIEVIPHIFQTVTGANPQNVVPLGQRGFFAYWRNTAKVLDPNGLRVLVTG